MRPASEEFGGCMTSAFVTGGHGFIGSRVVRHGGFPLGWLAVVGVFLLIQNRIDRRDPKLALAPVWSEPDVAFADNDTPEETA